MKKNKDRIKKKIVIMGLDAAGKSSILLSLKNDTRLSSYCSLNPTLDINREVIEDDENEFYIFDFGGQRTLVDGYLQRLDEHLAGVDKIIFVIDIQDTDRFTLATDYLREILDYITTSQISPAVSVFFHKYDKSLPAPELTRLDAAIQELVENVSGMIPPGVHVEFSKTTIFTVFQKMIMK